MSKILCRSMLNQKLSFLDIFFNSQPLSFAGGSYIRLYHFFTAPRTPFHGNDKGGRLEGLGRGRFLHTPFRLRLSTR